MEVAPFPDHLEPLPHFHAAPAPHPTHRSDQSYPHLVRPAHVVCASETRITQLGSTSPLFHASCSARFAFACSGRGTLGLHRSRSSRLDMPPSVYVTPKVSATQARIATPFRKRPVSTSAANC